MADSIELVIGVDTRQLDRATAGLAKASSAVNLVEKNVRDMMKAFKQGFSQDKLLSVFSRLEKSGMAFSGVVKSLTQDQKMAEKSAGDYNNKLLGVDKAFKSAKSSADAFSVAMKKQETNNKLAAKENERLNHKFVEGYTAMDRYSKELNDLALARKGDIITARQQKTAVAQLNAEMKAGTGIFAASGAVQQQTKNRMNGNNMAIQQLGYQFGDFAVQVQGGTSAFVAFSQQGAQLAGILPMIAGPLGLTMGAAVGLSAALGILIPVGSALGRFFYEMFTGAEKAKDALNRFSQALGTVKSSVTITRTSLAELRKEYGDSAEAIKRLSGLVLRTAVEKSIVAMSDAIDPFSEKLAKAADTIKLAKAEIESRGSSSEYSKAFSREIKEVSEELRILPDDIAKLGKAFDAVTSAVKLPDIKAAAESALDLIDNMNFEGKTPEAITVAVEKLNDVLKDSARAVTVLDTAYTDLSDDAPDGKKLVEGNRERIRALSIANLEIDAINGVAGAEDKLAKKKAFYDRSDFIRGQLALKQSDKELKASLVTYDALVKQLQVNSEATEISEIHAKLAEAESQAKKDLAEIDRDRNTLFEEDNKLQTRKIEISETIAKYGKDSIQVEDELAKYARDDYKLMKEKQGFHSVELDSLMLQYDLLQITLGVQKDITEEIKALEIATKNVTNSFKGLSNIGGSIEKKLVMATAELEALKEGGDAANTSMIAGLEFELALRHEIAIATASQAGDLVAMTAAQMSYNASLIKLAKLKGVQADIASLKGKGNSSKSEEQREIERLKKQAEQMNLNANATKKYAAEYAKLVKLKDSGLGDEAFAKEVAKLNEELAKSNPLLNSFTDAFADFLGRGARDFKSFAKDILNDFKSMLIQMITTAARNKIMFSMGMGGGALGTAAAAGGGGTGSSIANLGVLGNAVSSFAGSGIASGFSSALGLGGYASQGLFNVVANAQVAVAAGANAMAASIGALAAPLLAVGAVFSFLRTKTKELDSGLRVTVDNMDVLVKSFKTIQKSRFWGLSKKVRTSEEEASSDISDPIVDAVVTIQESVMEAASAFGVASDKFNDFTYDFEVSLKGLTEDQKMEKLNEEFTKLGDTFTEMSELFTSMNDLLAVYQQRLELEKQLLVAQGDVVKLREQELETIHVLNRDLATRLHLLQAEGDTQSALTAFASGISEQQGIIRRAVDALVKPLQDAIDRTRTQAEKSYSIFKTAADKSADSAKNIVDIITSALDSRTIISESAELMRYQTAQKQLASFAGGAEFDEASLRKATEGVSIDSQKFFGSFEDYARDFYRTQINLEDLAAVAEKELSDVEQQIDIAQKAYEVAMGTYQEAVDLNTAIETLAQDLNIYEATKLANEPLIKMVQDEGDRQIELLDSILVETTKQVNIQLGIESSMADLVGNTMSIGEAMGVLGLEAESLAGGVLALEDIERDINGNVTDLGLYVVDFEGAVKKLDTSVFDLTGTVDDLDGDIKTLFDNINLLDGGIDDFGVKVDGLGVSTDNLGIDITSLGATLSSAMSSLGSIVSGLSSAVSGLASSNNNLAAAQQKAASASKIATITTEAAGIAAEISSIESSRGTTATGATPAQKSQLAKLEQDLLDEENSDDKNLGTWHYRTLINNLNKEIAEQSVPAELSPGTSLALAALSGALDTLRKEVTDLGGTATFATGGYHSGGMRLVGENGPELEATGPSRIYSAQQTKNMLSGGSGEVVVELRSLRREVSELKAEQRKVGVENVKYNKKSYDLYREWDTVGLPATRTA